MTIDTPKSGDSAKKSSDVAFDHENNIEEISKEDMLALVRAIKFAKPEASMREVHREITGHLSQNESFEFLANVKLNEVKKVWKKASTESSVERQEKQQRQNQKTTNSSSGSSSSDGNGEEKIWKFYTVGNASVKTLAEEYSQVMAAQVITEEQAAEEESQQEKAAIMNNYVHVFLDVPANRSGSLPHQAVINFNDKQQKQGKTKKKGKSRDIKYTTNSAQNDGRGEIVKIQFAASDDGIKHPMLLYNQDRSSKTFIHPDEGQQNQREENLSNGYDCIRSWIEKKGVGGALGNTGGSKAYFFARRTIRKHGSDILSIDITELAPAQEW
mmetsp:Transcript_26831/g.40771  ORF Transcript_26831/g.40771 Transcript_26831/m.40771 type:complete len:328 (-) Transcript_26831:919-1902(-)